MRWRASRAPQPPLLIVSSRERLTLRYGPLGFQAIDCALREICRHSPGGEAIVAYLDDEASMGALGSPATSCADPSAIRKAVERLEGALAPGGRVSLWIAGGDDIIPRFWLPNPTQDDDGALLSDAPYACAGDDYYRPLRAVTRLPDLAGGDGAGFAATALRCLSPGPAHLETASGYTASVWREAAQAVFTLLGPIERLRMSPPWGARHYQGLGLGQASVRYFNLHGKPDGRQWYGQSDPFLAAAYDDFPVAMRRSDVSAAEPRGSVVVTEACYGATLAAGSIATRFLRLGAAVLFGSTAMSYGAINAPVSGADMLAMEFLRRLLGGATAGDAFLQAKTAFARTMMAEQGFLDPEDQKTLLSFVLYGDPRHTLPDAHRRDLPAPATPDPRYEVVCARAITQPLTDPPRTLMAELEGWTTALMGEPNGLWRGCRQGTCSVIPSYRYGHLSSGGGRVLSIRQGLREGGSRWARLTIEEGRVRKTLVSR